MAFLNSETKNKVEGIINSLNDYEKDMLYRILWLEYVKQDIDQFAEDNDIDIEEGDVDVAAERYVFEGEYDCNLSYWVNINNLLS